VTPEHTDAEIKKAYCRLMSQNHPDKLVSRGLPKEMLAMATKKTKAIQKAYELIERARRLN
jgi:DnaJ like chaperone protein